MEDFSFKKAKLLLGKKYEEFKRHNDVYFEVFRLQAVLLCPFITKEMFNFLTLKLLKLEEERLEMNKIQKYLENDKDLSEEYFKYYLMQMDEIRYKYKTELCHGCGSIFYKEFLGGVFCMDCFF